MHYAPHALLNCVAWFSLLCYGNAAKGAAPADVLSHFARTVGSVLVPTLANEISSRTNRSINDEEPIRHLETRQVQQPQNTRNLSPHIARQDLPHGNPEHNNIPLGFPYQYERTYQYRYPPYTQQISHNFFPNTGNAGFGNQGNLPLDSRFFQGHAGGNRPLAPIQPEIPKPLSANISPNVNVNDNPKENTNNNANSIQNIDTNTDSKSSAQNRPYDSPDYGSLPNQGGGFDPGNGNLRINNRFSAIDYERVRQNYYSDPPINQQRNYFSSFNDIPFNGGPYRSPYADRYSNLDYNGGPGRGGGPELRSGGGIGDPYYGNFFQGPYQSLNYNSIPGGGGIGNPGGDGGGPPFPENFDRSSNYRGGYNGFQYPNSFNGPFYPGVNGGGGGGGEYNDGDSSLRASSAKETLSGTGLSRNSGNNNNKEEDRSEKVHFDNNNDEDDNKRDSDDDDKTNSSQA